MIWRGTAMRVTVLAVLLAAATAAAAVEPDASARPLVVAITDVPPFAIARNDGTWSGLSVDLWARIADRLGLRWEPRTVALADVNGLLGDGTVDVALGFIAISAEGENIHDYTVPYLTAGLGFAEPSRKGPSWRTTVAALADSGLFSILATIAGAIVLIGAIIAVIERRRNAEQFGGSLPRGIATGVWWAAVTMTTVGYGDTTPKTASGRSVALVWMFVGVAAVAIFTATITSVLTVGSLQGSVQHASDLMRLRLGAMDGARGAEFLRERHVGFTAYPSITEALTALADGKLDGTVASIPLLRYLVSRRWNGVLRVSPLVLEPVGYAIGLPTGSALREPINRALLGIIQQDQWRDVEREYLGNE